MVMASIIARATKSALLSGHGLDGQGAAAVAQQPVGTTGVL